MPIFSFLLWLWLVWSAGWLFFPFSKRLFDEVLPDAGLGVGRILFLVVWTLGAFWLGFAHVPIAWSAGLYLPLALVGLKFWLQEHPALTATLRQKRRAIYSVEAIFLGIFLCFFLLRGFWSDTSGTNGEKGMDSVLIGALTRADHLPPPNPYAAGARLQSYYYTGHLSAALLTRASFTTTRWSYNWMCATLPALCFSTLFALGAAITGRLRGGVFVAASVLMLGTLQPLYAWTHQDAYSPGRFLRLDYFSVSRVIPFTINEFPWFTFQQADLHAHYFSFPLQMALMTVAWAAFRRFSLSRAGLASVLLGALVLTNTWDFLFYSVFILLALGSSDKQGTLRRLGIGLGAVLGALLIASPFLLLLKSAATPPKLLQQPASPLREWLLMWGPIGAAWWIYSAKQITAGSATANQWRIVIVAAIGWCVMGWFTTAWGQSSWLVLPLIGLSIILAMVGIARLQDEHRFVCVLALAGLGALLWSETTWAGFLGDPNHLGFDDYKRQDTVFKFGLQCWFLWGTASASGLWLVLNRSPRWQRVATASAFAPFVLAMWLGSTAVVFGRTRNFGWDNQTRSFSHLDGWDGWAHLATPEKAAATWLQNNARPNDFLLEAEKKEGGDFSESPRYAHATGIPTVIGPLAHSFYWSPANSGQGSAEWDAVNSRKRDARLIYTSLDPQEQERLLQFYKVRFVIWGDLEKQQYPDSPLGRSHLPFLKPVADYGLPELPGHVEIFEFVP